MSRAARRRLSCAAALALFVCGHGQPAQQPTLYTFRHPAMGTEFALYLYANGSYANGQAQAEAVAGEVFDEIDRIEQELSNYRPSSELSRINQQAAAGAVTTDPETFGFLQAAQHWSAASGGAFDMTVGPLMRLWGFFDHDGHVPSAAELERVRPVVGYRNVALDAATRTVRFRTAGVELDPGGIGKGFAVDAAVAILRAQHVRSALLSADSSTLYALGRPPGQRGWRVVVPDVDAAGTGISTVWLRDTSLSSANCREKNFTRDGHLYCHIMDPRTLRPVEGRLHVSILDPSATTSDALSNVLFVDTPAESLRFLRRYAPEARALIVSRVASASRVASTQRCTAYRWQGAIDRRRCPALAAQAR